MKLLQDTVVVELAGEGGASDPAARGGSRTVLPYSPGAEGAGANDGRVAARLRELRELLGPERVRDLLAGGGGVGGEKYASTGAAIVGAGVGLAALGPLTAVALAAGAGAAAHAAVGRGAAPPAEIEAAPDAEAPTGGYFSGGAAAAAAAAAVPAAAEKLTPLYAAPRARAARAEPAPAAAAGAVGGGRDRGDRGNFEVGSQISKDSHKTHGSLIARSAMPVVTVVAITGTRWIPASSGPSVNCALSGPTRATAACVIAATGKVLRVAHLEERRIAEDQDAHEAGQKIWWSSCVLSKNCVRKNSGMSRNWRPNIEFEMMSVVMKVSFEMAPPPLCHARTQDPGENKAECEWWRWMSAQLTGAPKGALASGGGELILRGTTADVGGANAVADAQRARTRGPSKHF